MRRLGLAIFLWGAVLLVSANAGAQNRVVTVSGNVYFGDQSHPAVNVLVNLSDSEQVNIATQATNGSGGFRFSLMRRGTYTVSVNASGYEPATVGVDMSFASDKGLSITLRPDAKDTASAAGSISTHELSMPAKARDLMASGKKKLYKDKDAAAGLADFQQAIAEAPRYYEVHYQVAMAYLTLGNRKEAEKSFRKSIEMSADNYGEAEVGLGTLMLDNGDYASAEKAIHRGIELNPNLWLGHYELGRALLNEKRVSDAQDSAEQARLLAPSVPIVYRLLSNIHLQKKDYPALLRDLDMYLKLDPDSAAGARAKQLREQVQQKIGPNHFSPL
jgi:carboxypeptidase family protein/tetratricopeptide repeat protein